MSAADDLTRVAPNPDRKPSRLVRYHKPKGQPSEAYAIEGPTDIPTPLAARLLHRGDVVETDADTAAEAARPPYDPSKYSAKVVLAYAAEHPDEVAAIVEAEAARGDKARKTVLELGD